MIDFRLKKVFSLIRQTAPFLLFRFLIYLGITLAYVLVTGTGAGIGYGLGRIGGNSPAGVLWGGFIGFGVVSVGVYMIREYLLYLVKAGHIAVLVELMDGNALPSGRDQIRYGQKIVRERFVESSLLFGLDQLIKGILKAFNRVFFSITAFLPIPGARGVVKFLNTVITLSLTFLDEVILAYNMRTKDANPWRSSKTALILYAQNYKAFLKNAFFLAFLIWGLTFVVFLLVLAPVAALVGLFPDVAGPFTLIIALVFAWGLKQALIEPVAMIALMQVFFKVTEGQEPNPEWSAKLESVSAKFKDLGHRAMRWTGKAASAEAAPADVPVSGDAPAPAEASTADSTGPDASAATQPPPDAEKVPPPDPAARPDAPDKPS